VDDYVDTNNSASVQLSTGTMSVWVKTNSPGASYRGILVKPLAYSIFLNDGEFGMYDWGASAWRGSGVYLNDNAWHHVVCSFQSGVSNGSLCYVDGVLTLTTTMTVNGQASVLMIGANRDPNPIQQINGAIDDVRIYNRALSADEVSRLYKLGR